MNDNARRCALVTENYIYDTSSAIVYLFSEENRLVTCC